MSSHADPALTFGASVWDFKHFPVQLPFGQFLRNCLEGMLTFVKRQMLPVPKDALDLCYFQPFIDQGNGDSCHLKKSFSQLYVSSWAVSQK